MGTIKRGIKNAFRNSIRTLAVTLILAISIGLALVMLLSYRTVTSKIESVKASIGNTITITPAGSQGFEGGGEPLTTAQMNDVKAVAHVQNVAATLNDRLTAGTDTNLASSIDPGTLGNRRGNFNANNTGGNTTRNTNQTPRTFTVPIIATGITDTGSLSQGGSSITAGTVFDGASDDNVAVVGKDLAAKNNLNVGSTFTAYTTTITVKAIIDSGNRFGNNGLYMPLHTLQRLSAQVDQVSSATVTVDSITNIAPTVDAIKAKIGADKADVVSNEDAAKAALAPLENIKNVTMYSLIGALAAGAIIILLTMMMIVRERRREIGVLKAIGASNINVVIQFVTESLTLTLLGGVLGMVLGIATSNPVLNALVASNTTSPAARGQGGGGFGRIAQAAGQFGGGFGATVRDLHNSAGSSIILYGLLAAVAIAIIGSAFPAYLISRVRPAEVMRGE